MSDLQETAYDKNMSEFHKNLALAVGPEWYLLMQSNGLVEDLHTILYKYIDLKDCTPSPDKIFRAFRETPLSDVKVVILGQDPYPGVGNGNFNACGLSFLVENGIYPPSLRNLHKELVSDIEYLKDSKIEEYDFMSWPKKGILMLNVALTTKIGQSNAHMPYWTRWSRHLISAITRHNPEIVWVGLGNYAKGIIDTLAIESSDNFGNKLIKPVKKVVAAHPSPLSQSKFFGSKIYTRINSLLDEKDKITW